MKKNILLTLALSLGYFLSMNAQTKKNTSDFSHIDAHAKVAEAPIDSSVQSLAKYLIQEAKTDEEKVRSFYIWITHNIAYDGQKYSKLKRKAYQIKNKEAFKAKLLGKVLSSKKAVCEGYAELFTALCTEANIPSFVVVGYTNKQVWKDTVVKCEVPSHAWNLVKLGKEWRPIDSTWGSGTIDSKTKRFKKGFKEDYFLADPTTFLETHLPADPMWQLIYAPIDLATFRTDSIELEAHLLQQDTSFYYRDSIAVFENFSKEEQILQTAINAHRAHPKFTEKLGIAYFNYANTLAKQLKTLPKKVTYENISQQYTTLIDARKNAIQFLKNGTKYEGALVTDYINYGNAITKNMKGIKAVEQRKRYKEKLTLFQTAKKILLETEEDSPIIAYSLKVCQKGIEATKRLLKSKGNKK